MALPEIIGIEPLIGPVGALINVPGSKSITNRALIMSALMKRRTVLNGALWSEDTEVMVTALRQLGFRVDVEREETEPSNRVITVEGQGGRIPNGGTREQPLEIYVGNAGTAARFVSALVCLGQGFYRISGLPRMHERPQGALFQALRELGYEVDTGNGKLPAVLQGRGARRGTCRVSIEESSQFASALLLAGSVAGWTVQITGQNADESPYVSMTAELVKAFQQSRSTSANAEHRFQIEADASSASYFWAADYLLNKPVPENRTRPRIRLRGAPESSWQVDAAFPRYLPLPPEVSRLRNLGDSILTAMIVAPFEPQPVKFTGLGRLRVQECERVIAMRTELGKCGVRVEEEGDTLTIFPSRELHGAQIETYDDHRVAMCFGILGLKVPGVQIKNPSCVKKTFPNFFHKLAATPAQGLGASIRDGTSGRVIGLEDLNAS